MNIGIEIWLDWRDQGDFRSVVDFDPEVSIAGVLVLAQAMEEVPRVQRAIVAGFARSIDDLDAACDETLIVSSDVEILRAAKARGLDTGWYAYIKNSESMTHACEEGARHSHVFVELDDETNIPLELLIAEFQPTRTHLLKRVSNLEEARVACGVLESGVGGVLVAPSGFGELAEFAAWQRGGRETLPMLPAVVRDVRSIGMGARVCVDTVELLTPADGLVVGSTAEGGLVVCSEVHPLPYMKLRPFRVNAGAVHSYVTAPAGRTNYLSELASGDPILITTVTGEARTVAIGRCKTEIRPLLQISAQSDAGPVSVVLQNDWHVRVFDPDGHARSITEIRAGDSLLSSPREGARHVGISVDEHCWEN